MAPQTSSAIECSETSYTTPNGLEFSLLCNQDQTGIGDIDNYGATSIEDCLDQCSTHSAKACGAVGYDTVAEICYFKNTNVTAIGATTRAGWILGIANETQYRPLPLACTSNGQDQTAQNGLAFRVLCSQTVVGFDACPDRSPSCRAHTDSLGACLDVCSTLHPLCTGAVWDPSLMYGYTNCYPKNSTSAFSENRQSSSDGLRTAQALIQDLADECLVSSNGTSVATNGDTFALSCNEDRFGYNITIRHTDSLSACINSCATYTKDHCVGVVFDTRMVNGYDNCYLKSAIAVATSDQTGFTLAVRSTPMHHKNKSWIAGPIVSAVVVAVTILLALWWFRTRRRRKLEEMGTQDNDLQEAWHRKELDTLDTARISETDALSRTQAKSPRHELDATTSVYQLEATSNKSDLRQT